MGSDALPQIVNFTAMVVFLGAFAKKPLLTFLSARSEDIKKQIDEAEQESKITSKAYTEAKQNSSQKEAHAQKLKEDAEAALERHRTRTLEAARKESARIIKDGEALGQGELLKKKEALQQEICERSVMLAQKYFSDQLEAKDKEKLVAEYVNLVDHGKA